MSPSEVPRVWKSPPGRLAWIVVALLVAPLRGGLAQPVATDGVRLSTPVGGPDAGTLLLAGGGRLGEEIIDRFVELAGDDARIVVIPTAGAAVDYDADWIGLDAFRRRGVADLRVLHTRDRDVADSPTFVRPLREATGVWITGGRQWRLVDAYLHTRTHDELAALLERGGVVGGSSAGASILASYLMRGSPEDNDILMAPGYEEGFGFLRGAAVDQHLLARNREHDLLRVLHAHPTLLLGIGIDEGTAIVVERDVLEVVGESRVAVYDRRGRVAPRGLPFDFLDPGDRYDLLARARR